MKSSGSTVARRIARTVLALAVVGGAAALVTHYAIPSGDDDASAAAHHGRRARVAPVLVATAQRETVPEVERSIGTIEAAAVVQVKSRVEGQIQQAFFHEGQTVRKGDLLFRIDPRPYQAALAQAQAVLARDKAQASNASANLGRYGNLSRKGYASAQQFDDAQAQAKALRATVAADEAAVEIARLNLSYTDIRSPIDGKTGVMLVHPGNLVKANGDVALVTVAQVRPVRVSFTLPQQDLPKLQSRMASGALQVSITIPGSSGSPLRAPVDFIDNQVNSAAGTIALRAAFSNADGRLVPGQFVNVSLEVTRFDNAVTVPRDAINAGQHGPYVYVVRPNQTVAVRPVEVAYQTDTVGVIGSGLSGGETVVRDGQLRLAPGMKVRIQSGRGRPAAGVRPASAEAPHGKDRNRKDRRS